SALPDISDLSILETLERIASHHALDCLTGQSQSETDDWMPPSISLNPIYKPLRRSHLLIRLTLRPKHRANVISRPARHGRGDVDFWHVLAEVYGSALQAIRHTLKQFFSTLKHTIGEISWTLFDRPELK